MDGSCCDLLGMGADAAQQCRTATMMRIVLLMKQGAAEKCPSNFIFDFVANGLIDVKFACVKRMPSLIDLGIDAAIVGEPMGLKLAYAVLARLAYPAFGVNIVGLIGKQICDDTLIEHRGIEFIASNCTNGYPPHVFLHPDYVDKTVLGTHAVYPSFGANIGGLIGEDTIFEHHGIEVIASNGTNGHPPHVTCPYCGDKPEAGALGAHAVYPSFRVNFGGPVGERLSDDAVIEHRGIVFIASICTYGHLPHVIFPGYEDKTALGTHAVYPSFGTNFGGLIGEDAIIERHGIEVIASNGTNGHPPHVIFPYCGDKPEAGVLDAYAVYPEFGVNIGGLIGDKLSDDATMEHHGIEIIASNGTICRPPHVIYPSHGDKSEAGVLGAHAAYPSFGVNFGGLIGEKLSDDAFIEYHILEIFASKGTYGHPRHAIYPSYGDKPEAGVHF